MNFERIACIYIADFPLVVLVDEPATPAQQPYAVAEQNHPNAPVLAINEAAAHHVKLGMTTSQCFSRCSVLHVLVRNHDRERAESRLLLERLQKVGPAVELAEPGRYYLEVDGLTSLYRGESGVAAKIHEVISDTRYGAQVGIAGNKLVAWLAACQALTCSSIIVPEGTEGQFILPLPMTALPLSIETKEQLHILGLSTVRDLSKLPSHEITERFGHDVLAIARYVRGSDTALLVSDNLPENLSAGLHLDYTVTSCEQLYEHITLHLGPLLSELRRSGRGCSTIRLRLTHEPQTPGITIRLDAPSANLLRWMLQIRTKLEQSRLQRVVSDIHLSLDNVVSLVSGQLPLQNITAAPGNPNIDNDGSGKVRLSTVALRSGVLPESGFAFLEHDASGTHGDARPAPLPIRYTARRIFGLRLYQPPRVIRAVTEMGMIRALTVNRRRMIVSGQTGPWYISGGWWQNAFERWYYDVVTAEGDIYLMYYDTGCANWFVHGIFD